MEECIICFDETDKLDFVIFPCKHKACVKCYPLILNERPYCPMCNALLIVEHISLNVEHNSLRIHQPSIIYRIYLEKCKCIMVFLFIIAILILYLNKK